MPGILLLANQVVKRFLQMYFTVQSPRNPHAAWPLEFSSQRANVNILSTIGPVATYNELRREEASPGLMCQCLAPEVRLKTFIMLRISATRQ